MEKIPDLPDRLIRLRQMKGQAEGKKTWSQARLAEALGVSENYVWRMEHGNRTPGDELLALIKLMEADAEMDVLSGMSGTSESPVLRVREEPSQVAAANPRDAVRLAREARGWSRKDLAEKAGVYVRVIQGIEEGTAGTSERVIERICKAMPELDCEALMAGSESPVILDESGRTGTFGARPQVETAHGVPKAKLIPVVGWAQAGALGHYTDEAYTGEGVIGFGVTDPDAVAIPIRGDSMSPYYSEGDVAIVLPNSQARDGDLVIASLHDHKGGDVMFKLFHLLSSAKDMVQMESYNPMYPSRIFNIGDFRFVYPVDSVVKKTRRR